LLDIAFLRSIVNMVVTAPKDEQELRNLLYSAIYEYKKPFSIRYPRGRSLGVEIKPFEKVPFASWEVVRDGKDIAILAVGKMVKICQNAALMLEDFGISAKVINCRFIKPLDKLMLENTANRFNNLFTVEDGTIVGGFGSAVLEYLAENKHYNSVKIIGTPDKIIEHGAQDELFEMLKLDANGIAETIRKSL